MNEPTAARSLGSDVTRSGWTPASDRADAPRPDAVRSEAAQAAQAAQVGRTLPGSTRPGEAPDKVESVPGVPGAKSAARDATFPTSYAQFAINSDTHKLSIKIVDAATNEVIREIPPEQVERIAQDLQVLGRRAAHGKPAMGNTGADGPVSGGVDRYV
jgi:flagellar protein FlaG